MTTDFFGTSKRPSVASEFVCSLAAASHDNRCGGKASNLGRMMQHGISVPDGFVIADPAFHSFLQHNQLRDLFAAKLQGMEANQTAEIDSASRFIHQRIMTATIPPGIVDSVEAMLSHDADGSVAGRT